MDREPNLFWETVGGGPPMLVMHGGLGLDHTYFRPWLDKLASRFKLIYYDHRGNGRSGGRNQMASISVGTWVDDADRLRSQLGHDRIVLFGHSHGGCLALDYALRYPDHLEALILCSTTPAFDYPDVIIGNARERCTPEVFEMLMGAFSKPIADEATFEKIWWIALPLYFANYDAELGKTMLGKIHFSVDAFNHFQFKCLPHFNVSSVLSQVSAPTLVLAGRHDWITPVGQAQRLAEGIPKAQLKIFERSGHFPFIEENDDLIRGVIRWCQ